MYKERKKYDIDKKLIDEVEKIVYNDIKDGIKLDTIDDCNLINEKMITIKAILSMIDDYRLAKSVE